MTSKEEYENEGLKDSVYYWLKPPISELFHWSLKLLLLRPSKQRSSNYDKAEIKWLIQQRNCAHDMFTNLLA
jgi:hypothetical protein